jgi:transcriptional regulator with XRE-family HTH domain
VDSPDDSPDDDPTTPANVRRMHENWEKEFSDKVRQWRHARNWSQEEVAERLRRHGFEMHQTTVAKIERGTRPLRVAEASALAAIFEVPPLAVFHGPGPEEQPENVKELQRQMDDAQRRLGLAQEMIAKTGELYATVFKEIQSLAMKINEAAADKQKKQDSLGSHY